jgi:ATP-binding cassette subfamily B protein
MVSAAITIIIPLIIRYITGDVLLFEKSEAIKITTNYSIIIGVLFLIMYGCNSYRDYYGHLIGAKMERDMRNELFEHYQKLSMSFYDNHKTGQLMSRMSTDLNNISEFMHHIPEDLTLFFIRFSGTVCALFFINNILAIVTVFILIFIISLIFLIAPKFNKIIMKVHQSFADINFQTEESLSGIKVVKSFANEQMEINKFHVTNKGFIKNKKEAIKMTAMYFPSIGTLIVGLVPLTAILAVFLIINGEISTSDLITFMLLTNVLVGPLFDMMHIFEFFQESVAGYRRFLEILDIKPEIIDSKEAKKLENVAGNIEFKNVGFKYEQNGGYIIKDLNLSINSGEYVALVGSSGAGKSTICSLISRFYDTTEGKITVDGIDIKNIKIKSLRENIGFVHQDTYLFADTICSNIKYGKPDASDKEVIEAAKNAYAHEFITGFQDGYNTDIGQRGLKLSGGQKQRISIARVFLKNPPILIFDEATSSLDTESEKYVQMSLEKLAKNRTTIVIAHRLSTIRNAQRIIVLREGKVAETGTHEELIAKKGAYFSLYNTRF